MLRKGGGGNYEEVDRKYAPRSWPVRRPDHSLPRSVRYTHSSVPTIQLLNARYKRPPRNRNDLVPVAIYSEPPFTTIRGRCSYQAIVQMESQCEEVDCVPSALHMLHFV